MDALLDALTVSQTSISQITEDRWLRSGVDQTLDSPLELDYT